MKGEIITLGSDGKLATEMVGFGGQDCLRHAQQVFEQLAVLGVRSKISAIEMKDRGAPPPQVHMQVNVVRKGVEVGR